MTWYSPEAIAAAVPSGILNFTIMSIFIGTAGYVSTFVAQYYGAQQHNKIGKVIWQGLYISLLAGVVHLGLVPVAKHIFYVIGHSPSVQKEEVVYFQILNLGAFFTVASSVMSGFFSGRGKTWTIMWVNVCATLVNMGLNYVLIFGKLGVSPLGIKGAGISSVLSQVFSFIVFGYFLVHPKENRKYNFVKEYHIDKKLLLRIIRFGAPNGMQMFIEIFGITFFILLVGRLGTESLAASNIALNINMLAFMPMIGFGITVSILVGQYIGKKNILLAEYSVFSCMHLTLVYMVFIAALYVIIPEVLLIPFVLHSQYTNIGQIISIAKTLLLFIAFFTLFDTFNIIFANAIKGAGDTKFVMYSISFLTIFILAIPSYLVLEVFKMHIYIGWGIFTVYVCSLAIAFYWRYRSGKWKEMQVIEQVR